MSKEKGQAFDTFKLMIAAVVAIAILGILLSILSGITPSITQKPVDVIKGNLASARCAPQGTTTAITFSPGDGFSKGAFEVAAGQPLTSLDVVCDEYITESYAECGNLLIVQQQFEAKMSLVCTSTGKDCTVLIGDLSIKTAATVLGSYGCT